MGKGHETWNKKDREQKRLKAKQEKQMKKKERQKNLQKGIFMRGRLPDASQRRPYRDKVRFLPSDTQLCLWDLEQFRAGRVRSAKITIVHRFILSGRRSFHTFQVSSGRL